MIALRRRTLSHTYTQTLMHVVFSTKQRLKLIPKEQMANTWAYMAGICKRNKIFVHEIGGMEDHAHLLIRIPPTMTLSDAVLEIKARSSKWMGQAFEWQRGYGAFSVSHSNLQTVVRYIRNQETKHRKMSFDGEFIALLKKHGIDFDLKYVFD
jgi:REP-associated tyrosine transposase